MKRYLRKPPPIGLDSMFETRTAEWSAAGLELEINAHDVRRARRRLFVLIVLLLGVVVGHIEVVHHFRLVAEHKAFVHQVLAKQPKGTPTPARAVGVGPAPADWHVSQQWFTALAVAAIVLLGWLISRDVSRIAPTLFKRMDPATAGTVGFLIRFILVSATALAALGVAGISPQTLAVGGAFTAIVLGLAAQQTLGNLFAGMVLLSARPFRLGERVRLQAGAVGGSVEGIVSSLGLLYTTLARGDDRILVPNNVVLAAAVVPLREPQAVDVKVRLSAGIRPSQVQQILDANVTTETRAAPEVVLEEIDGDVVVVRVRATPDRRSEGAKLADEIIVALGSVTAEHEVPDPADPELADHGDAARR